MTTIPKPTTLSQFRTRYDLVTRWIDARRRQAVQINRHREMGRALRVLETMPEGTHAGYERSFTYLWAQVRQAMIRDGWGPEVQAVEEAEGTWKEETA